MKSIEQLKASLKSHLILQGGGPDEDGISVQLTYMGVAGALQVIASWGEDWDHVSVSRPDRTPYWDEMCFVKDFFFHQNECVIQYHPPKTSYINNHRFCLHLWRPQNATIITPPLIFV